jgi:hypothetical protein
MTECDADAGFLVVMMRPKQVMGSFLEVIYNLFLFE